jgi:molybdenum-dependent DNA-binding transcriptional regulator ModE
MGDEIVIINGIGRKRMKQNGNQKQQPELKAKQLRAIMVIIEAGSMEEAARRAGVGKTALYEWMKQEPFRKRLEEARAEVFNEGLGVIKAGTSKAARKLIELLDSRNENTRRLTAQEILALSLKIKETQEFERRIERLEELLEARMPGA